MISMALSAQPHRVILTLTEVWKLLKQTIEKNKRNVPLQKLGHPSPPTLQTTVVPGDKRKPVQNSKVFLLAGRIPVYSLPVWCF